jgi:hypothetical protein
MSRLCAWKHRGIRLGKGQVAGIGPTRYRVRTGREVSYTTVEGLNREWLDAYVQYLREFGHASEALKLRNEWLIAKRMPA